MGIIMSGSSALASARRRRAGNPETPIQNNQPTIQNNVQVNNSEVSSNQRMTPLQILKIHDDKLKILEESIGKINLMELTSNNKSTTNNSVNELNEIKFDQLNNKIIHLSEIVKSLQINIENISRLNIIENDQYKIMNDGIMEINNLKTSIIETHRDILSIKNDISLSKTIYEKHDSILQNLSFENTENDAESLFKSVLEQQFNDNLNGNYNFDKIIINDDNEDYSARDILNKEIEILTIDSNLNENTDNLTDKISMDLSDEISVNIINELTTETLDTN